jgi:uncharacterized protein
MQYFRSYSRGRQLTFFMILVFSMFLAASLFLNGVMAKAFGVTITQIEGITENSSDSLVRVAMFAQAISSIIIFLVPGLLFAYLAHPSPRRYLGLVRPGKPVQFLLVLLLMAGSLPILQVLEFVIGRIDFGESVKKTQEASDSMMAGMMRMKDLSDFFKVFFVMAIIPGVGEEIFFRGVMLRFSKVPYRPGFIMPIVFTALVFAMAHSNIFGFLSIFLAGCLLGLIYYLTGSLWCSIMAHVFFNGSQIVLSFLSLSVPVVRNFTNSSDFGHLIPWVIAGAAVFSFSLYLLWQKRTPLPGIWPADFTNEEIVEIAEGGNV